MDALPAGTGSAASMQAEPLKIREGDVLKISFPGATNLDSTQAVRRDGRITLTLGGEMIVAGLTPSEVEQQLLEKYASQLVTKEVTVSIASTSFGVYVSGSVLRPGKVMSDRPITALEAIMEAGGFDPAKADARAVVVIRQEEGHTKNYKLNLRDILEGKSGEQFYLKPSDIIYVPEKFTLF